MSSFIESFKKIINMVDPVANSKITAENTNIKILADWSRKACIELEKYNKFPSYAMMLKERRYAFAKLNEKENNLAGSFNLGCIVENALHELEKYRWLSADEPPSNLSELAVTEWETMYEVIDYEAKLPYFMKATDIWLNEGSEVEFYREIILPERK